MQMSQSFQTFIAYFTAFLFLVLIPMLLFFPGIGATIGCTFSAAKTVEAPPSAHSTFLCVLPTQQKPPLERPPRDIQIDKRFENAATEQRLILMQQQVINNINLTQPQYQIDLHQLPQGIPPEWYTKNPTMPIPPVYAGALD